MSDQLTAWLRTIVPAAWSAVMSSFESRRRLGQRQLLA